MIPLMTLQGIEMVEVRVPREAHIVGKQVRQVLLPQGSLLSLIISDGSPRVPTPETVIRPDDILVAVTSIESEEQLRYALISPTV